MGNGDDRPGSALDAYSGFLTALRSAVSADAEQRIGQGYEAHQSALAEVFAAPGVQERLASTWDGYVDAVRDGFAEDASKDAARAALRAYVDAVHDSLSAGGDTLDEATLIGLGNGLAGAAWLTAAATADGEPGDGAADWTAAATGSNGVGGAAQDAWTGGEDWTRGAIDP